MKMGLMNKWRNGGQTYVVHAELVADASGALQLAGRATRQSVGCGRNGVGRRRGRRRRHG